MLNVHYSRASDLELPDHLTTTPPVPIGSYRGGADDRADPIHPQPLPRR
jgi:hypothetical protein